jgi:hypothetical protein
MNIQSRDLRAIRIGGLSLLGAAAGFIAVFSYLAARFNYPDVLDGDAATVLPRLLALGEQGRAVWAVYAFLPFLIIPGAIGARAALADRAPNAMRAALVFAVIAAVSMFLGLARWPSVHLEFARAYPMASAAGREAIDAIFRGLNVYLGNYIGEFLGELSLNAFFVLAGIASLRSNSIGRWFGVGGIVAGVIGWTAMFRNVSSLVTPVAAVNNYLLPLWLITLGIVFLAWNSSRSSLFDRRFRQLTDGAERRLRRRQSEHEVLVGERRQHVDRLMMGRIPVPADLRTAFVLTQTQ